MNLVFFALLLLQLQLKTEMVLWKSQGVDEIFQQILSIMKRYQKRNNCKTSNILRIKIRNNFIQKRYITIKRTIMKFLISERLIFAINICWTLSLTLTDRSSVQFCHSMVFFLVPKTFLSVSGEL